MEISETKQKSRTVVHIYYLVRSDTGLPFYVGKTVIPLHDRLRQHKRDSDDRRGRAVRKALRNGGDVSIHLIEDVPLHLWEERERFWIAVARAVYGRSVIKNDRDGGQDNYWVELREVLSPEELANIHLRRSKMQSRAAKVGWSTRKRRHGPHGGNKLSGQTRTKRLSQMSSEQRERRRQADSELQRLAWKKRHANMSPKERDEERQRFRDKALAVAPRVAQTKRQRNFARFLAMTPEEQQYVVEWVREWHAAGGRAMAGKSRGKRKYVRCDHTCQNRRCRLAINHSGSHRTWERTKSLLEWTDVESKPLSEPKTFEGRKNSPINRCVASKDGHRCRLSGRHDEHRWWNSLTGERVAWSAKS